MRSIQFLSTTAWPLLAATLLAIPSLFGAESVADAAHRGDTARLRALLEGGADPRTPDAEGNTALHWAALHGNADWVKELLERGAQADATNAVGATPLLYAVGNLDSVRILVEHGAEVNRASRYGTTPLLAAARYPRSHAVARFLLDQGADPKARDNVDANAFEAAAAAGDLATVRMLLAAGVKPRDVIQPARMGHREIVEAALDAGASLNADAGFAGHALNFALYGQQPEIARLLIERGADLNLRSPAGEHHTPPILWAAYNERGDTSVARLMIEQGVDVNLLSALGESALDWARDRNNRALENVLRDAGAREGSAARKRKSIPNRELPDGWPDLDPLIRQSIPRAVALLQHTSDVFLRSGVVQHQTCVSCHQQTLPAVAFAWARERGLPVDAVSIARQVQDQVRYWSKNNKIPMTYEMIRPQPDAPVLLGYGLMGLSALGYPADALTEAMVWHLAAIQLPDGSWAAADYRPPMEDGPIQGTAFALHALRKYPLPARRLEMERRVELARGYLSKASPVTFNQRVFQLLGLGWSGEDPVRLQSHVAAILETQQTDGGWAQLEGLPSDAWATGQALVALNTVGGLACSDPAFQKGVRFLLRTQFEDGSWYVRSRAWPFQPHFESEFPHGKDQWISAGGTAWAAMALLLTLPETGQLDTVDWMTIPVPKRRDTPRLAADEPAKPADEIRQVDYVRDIEPLLQRSCAPCHASDKKKGQFSIASREEILQGGQSHEPVLIPGNSGASRLIQMVSGQVEDLEMPPLAKRDRYPGLTRDELALLKRWIDEGLRWKSVTSDQ